MRWFKTKDGTIYPEPQNAPEAVQVVARDMAQAKAPYLDCDQALLDKARQTAHENQLKFQRLQAAVRSIVLRLRVLDLEQLAKDVGEDGSVPLRLAIAELRALDKAYDGKEDMAELLKRVQEYPFVDQTTVATTTSPYDVYTSSTTTAPYYYSYGGKKP